VTPPLLVFWRNARTIVSPLTWTQAKEQNVFFYSQVFQQLLNSTIVCLMELSWWAGRQRECPCSCQKTLLILKGQLSQAIAQTTSSFPKSSLPFFSYLLNHCFFNRKPKKSLFTLNIGLFIFSVFIVAKQFRGFL